MNARDYQTLAVESAFEKMKVAGSTLITMPTGTGKTVVFSHIAARAEKRVLVLAHREELIRQAAHKLHAVTGEEVDIEMADERADAHMFKRAKVIVASKDTLRGKRLERFDPKEFSHIIIDEAHHAVSVSYTSIVEYFKKANPDIKVVGVTATPDRLDMLALGKVFETVAFTYEIEQAIDDGWLVPISARTVEIEGMDFSKVTTTAGDLNGRELAEIMDSEKVLHPIVMASIEEAKWKKAIVFAPPGFKNSSDGTSFRISERLCELFNRYRPNSARVVTQDTDSEVRRQIITDFANGLFQFLINVGVFTEGFDDPTIDMVILARPTKSRALYCQMVGRGTRPLPGIVDGHADAATRRTAIALSDKPRLEVLDFSGNSGKHKLVTTADILGGRYDDAVRARAQEKAKDGVKDVREALEEAYTEIEREREEQKRQAESRRNKIKAKAKWSVTPVNPFDVFDIEPERRHEHGGAQLATERQIEYLNRAGIAVPEGLTKSKATSLIIGLRARKERGLCTPGQIRLLKKYGVDFDEKSLSSTEAGQLIAQMRANGWAKQGA